MNLQPGDIILNGKYRVEALVGKGAFAEVYRATHIRLNALRAIKVLGRQMPGIGSEGYGRWRERFAFEARWGAILDHPNVINVYDFEEVDGELCLVMEYAAGGSLRDRLTRLGPLGVDEAISLALDVSAGLAAIHERLQAVHRDIKPSNILLGGDGRAKIADLGLAQVPGGGSLRTVLGDAAGLHPGTPEYMSPEQGRDRDYLLPTSDIFSFGCVLFEALTGKLYKSAYGTRVRDHRPEVPKWLDEIIARALAEQPGRAPADDTDPGKRYRTAALLQADLERGWKEQKQHRKPKCRLHIAPWIRRTAVAILLSGVVVGAAYFTGWISWGVPIVTRQVQEWRGRLNDSLSGPPPGLIAFESFRDGNWAIYAMQANGTGLRRLTDDPADERSPAWSPDGRQIAFASNRTGQWDIYSMNVDGSGLRHLTFDSSSSDGEPAWSPDGGRIAYVSRHASYALMVMSVDGSLTARLPSTSLWRSSPSWSPDGRRIAFEELESGGHRIATMAADGTDVTVVTKGSRPGQSPAWSPDGQQIAFSSEDRDGRRLCIIGSDGANVRLLTDGSGDDCEPIWSPDGRYLAFSSYRDGNQEVYIMRVDGSKVKRLTDDPAADGAPSWQPVRR